MENLSWRTSHEWRTSFLFSWRKKRGRAGFGSSILGCHVKVDRFAGHVDYSVSGPWELCTAQPDQTHAGTVCHKRDGSVQGHLPRERVRRRNFEKCSNLECKRKKKISEQGKEEGEIRETQLVQKSTVAIALSVPLCDVQTFQSESSLLPSTHDVKSISLSLCPSLCLCVSFTHLFISICHSLCQFR